MKTKRSGTLVSIGELNGHFLDTWTRFDTPWSSPKINGGWGRGWPSAANTGPAAAPDYPGSLTTNDGSSILSNSTYAFQSFTGLDIGSASSPVHNVHFHGCSIHDVSVNGALTKLYADGPIALTFCDLGPADPFVLDSPVPFADSVQYGITFSGAFSTYHDWLLIDSCLVYGYGNSIDMGNPGSSVLKPVTIRHTAVLTASEDGFDDGAPDPYHTDGPGHLTGFGGEAHLTLEHNTIESHGNTNGIALQQGVYDHIKVHQNLLGGYGFTVAIWDDPGGIGPATNVTFTDNVLSTRLKPNFGPVYGRTPAWGSLGNIWKRNRLHVPASAEWGNPAHDGRYWYPTPGLDLSDPGRDYNSGLISGTTEYAP